MSDESSGLSQGTSMPKISSISPKMAELFQKSRFLLIKIFGPKIKNRPGWSHDQHIQNSADSVHKRPKFATITQLGEYCTSPLIFCVPHLSTLYTYREKWIGMRNQWLEVQQRTTPPPAPACCWASSPRSAISLSCLRRRRSILLRL